MGYVLPLGSHYDEPIYFSALTAWRMKFPKALEFLHFFLCFSFEWKYTVAMWSSHKYLPFSVTSNVVWDWHFRHLLNIIERIDCWTGQYGSFSRVVHNFLSYVFLLYTDEIFRKPLHTFITNILIEFSTHISYIYQNSTFFYGTILW